MENLGKRIHNARINANLTMQELGAKCGVKASAVNKWEKEIVTNIPIDMLVNISNALNMDLTDLIDTRSSAEQSVEMIESRMNDLDNKALDRLIKYAQYLMSCQKG